MQVPWTEGEGEGEGAGTIEGSIKGSGGFAYDVIDGTDALDDMNLTEYKKVKIFISLSYIWTLNFLSKTSWKNMSTQVTKCNKPIIYMFKQFLIHELNACLIR